MFTNLCPNEMAAPMTEQKPDMEVKTGRKSRWDMVLTLCVLALAVLLPMADAKSCNQDSACSCTFDDGSGTVDITNMGNNDGTPLINNAFAADNYAYSFNPCYPFSVGTCANCAACQYDATNVVYYNIGDSSKVTFSYDGLNVIGTYVSDDGARSSIVTFVCDPNTDPATYTVDGETSTAVYSFTVTSKYACASGAGPVGPTSGPSVVITTSISAGTVLTIIFISFIAVYLIAGVSFNKFARHNSGRELVPNVSFWSGLPGLIKDGSVFTFSLCGRRAGYSRA